MLKEISGSLLDLVAPATGRDWQIYVNNTYGGVAKFKTLFGVRLTYPANAVQCH